MHTVPFNEFARSKWWSRDGGSDQENKFWLSNTIHFIYNDNLASKLHEVKLKHLYIVDSKGFRIIQDLLQVKSVTSWDQYEDYVDFVNKFCMSSVLNRYFLQLCEKISMHLNLFGQRCTFIIIIEQQNPPFHLQLCKP